MNYFCPDEGTCTVFYAAITIMGLIFFISIFLLYPFYFMAFRKNRERDQASSSTVFYILKHFYNVVNFMEVVFLMDILAGIATIYFQLKEEYLLIIPCAIILFSTLNLTLAITMIENLMLSLLAIYRFSIYFFSQTENLLTKIMKIFRKTVIWLYVLIFLTNFAQRTFKIYVGWQRLQQKSSQSPQKVGGASRFLDFSGIPIIDTFDRINENFYIGLTVLQFLSAFLYLPILFNVRKKRGLQSAKIGQPEKYILYQTVFLVAFRMLYIPCIIWMYMRVSEINGEMLFSALSIADVFVTHFIIQASYLSCNKKHMESLLSSCGKWNKVSVRYTSTMESTVVGTN